MKIMETRVGLQPEYGLFNNYNEMGNTSDTKDDVHMLALSLNDKQII